MVTISISSTTTSDELNASVTGASIAAEVDPHYALTEINYTAHADLAPRRRITFKYEQRPDKITGYFHGARHEMGYRLSSIDVHGPCGLVNDYRFGYEEVGELSALSRLSWIKRCDANGICLPSTRFYWEQEQPLTYTEVSSGSLSSAPLRFQRAVVANVQAKGTGQLLVPRKGGGDVRYYDLLFGDGRGNTQRKEKGLGISTKSSLQLVAADLKGNGRSYVVGAGHLEYQIWEFANGIDATQVFSAKLADREIGIMSVGDFDGDGKQEILVPLRSVPPSALGTQYAVIDESFALKPIQAGHGVGTYYRGVVLDSDGDGKDEYLTYRYHDAFFPRDAFFLELQRKEDQDVWIKRTPQMIGDATTIPRPHRAFSRRFSTAMDWDDLVLLDGYHSKWVVWLSTGIAFVEVGSIPTSPFLRASRN